MGAPFELVDIGSHMARIGDLEDKLEEVDEIIQALTTVLVDVYAQRDEARTLNKEICDELREAEILLDAWSSVRDDDANIREVRKKVKMILHGQNIMDGYGKRGCLQCASSKEGGTGNHHNTRGRTCRCCGSYIRGDSMG